MPRERLPMRSRNVAVGRTKNSMDAKRCMWFRRNIRNLCDGGLGRSARYLDTVACETSMPRGAHRGSEMRPGVGSHGSCSG